MLILNQKTVGLHDVVATCHDAVRLNWDLVCIGRVVNVPEVVG